MMQPSTIKILTSNDLSYDQRMLKVAQSLSEHGYRVELIGRVLPDSRPIKDRSFQQTRLNCLVHSGPLFYLLLNIRLLFYLLFRPCDIVYAVDLDTISAAVVAGKMKSAKIVFDAHEYFTEVPELERRPFVQAFWRRIGKAFVPRVDNAITVGDKLSEILSEKYRISFTVIRNCPRLSDQALRDNNPIDPPTILIYQGVLNEGRGLEQMIDVMQELDDVELWMAGEGDISEALRNRVHDRNLTNRVRFLGRIAPSELPAWTARGDIGLNLLEERSLNYYYSLANKFFDYIHAGLPSINMEFPEYQHINEKTEVSVLISSLDGDAILEAIYSLIDQPDYYQRLHRNCLELRQQMNWEEEEQKLLDLLAALDD